MSVCLFVCVSPYVYLPNKYVHNLFVISLLPFMDKRVITILEDTDMPLVKDGIRIELIIGSSSIIKRETISQMLEAACGIYVNDHMEPNVSYNTDEILQSFNNDFNVQGSVYDKLLSTYESGITIGDYSPRRIVRRVYDTIAVATPVKANYGIIRVMQSCFLSSFRMSCTVSNSDMIGNGNSAQLRHNLYR